MKKAIDFAKFFISKELDSHPNTFDGNMKLQKLLVFAYLLSLAKYNEPLFSDEIMAFKHGYVVDNVRKRYQYDYYGLKAECETYTAHFTEKESYIIKCTMDIYGHLQAKDLSALSHEFDFWNESYNKSKSPDGYYDKEKSIIPVSAMQKEVNSLKKVLFAYEQRKASEELVQCINGINFYYSPSFKMTDEIIDYLYNFSTEADKSSYNVYLDNNNLVVY